MGKREVSERSSFRSTFLREFRVVDSCNGLREEHGTSNGFKLPYDLPDLLTYLVKW